MAAKDADLARDLSLGFVYLTDEIAAFEIELTTTPPESAGPRTREIVFIGDTDATFEIEATATPHGTGGGAGVVYRMRGFDQNVSVNGYVFWSSSTVDSGATNYAGSAGPVVDIVVHSRIGV